MNRAQVADVLTVLAEQIAAGRPLAASVRAAGTATDVDMSVPAGLIAAGSNVVDALKAVDVDQLSAHRFMYACMDPHMMPVVASQLRCEAAADADPDDSASAAVLRWFAQVLPVMPWVNALTVCGPWAAVAAAKVARGDSVPHALSDESVPRAVRRWAAAEGQHVWVSSAEVVASRLLGCRHLTCRSRHPENSQGMPIVRNTETV